jgi:hypothetical protein
MEKRIKRGFVIARQSSNGPELYSWERTGFVNDFEKVLLVEDRHQARRCLAALKRDCRFSRDDMRVARLDVCVVEFPCPETNNQEQRE